MPKWKWIQDFEMLGNHAVLFYYAKYVDVATKQYDFEVKVRFNRVKVAKMLVTYVNKPFKKQVYAINQLEEHPWQHRYQEDLLLWKKVELVVKEMQWVVAVAVVMEITQ